MYKINKFLDNPLNKLLLWVGMGIIVCLIGITNVFADEITFQNYDYQVYYDNNGSSVSQVGQSWSSSFMAYVSNNITTSANSYGAGVVISSGIPIISGHAYSLSFYFEQTHNIALSSKNRIAIGSTVANSASNYANANYNATMLTSKVVNNTTLQFAFTANTSNQFIFIPWTTTSSTTQTYVFTSYIINDLGASSGVSQSDINNSLSSQTNILNQSITTSERNITNAIQSTEESINNTINDNFQTCRESVNLFDKNNAAITSLNSNDGGTFYNASTTKSIVFNSTNYDTLTISKLSGIYFVIIGSNEYPVVGTTVGHILASSQNGTTSLTVNASNYNYLTIVFWRDGDTKSLQTMLSSLQIQTGSVATNYEEYGTQICSNKLDEAENTRKGILGKIGDLISYINPTSPNFFVYKLIELLVNALKSLFIPEDLSFLNTFKDTISNKLGFIASIPIQIIDFILDLPNAVFQEVNTLHFPRVNIFGYYFWDDMEIDLTIGKSIFSAIKYLTDLTCIVLCVNTLWKWYHSFTGGDTN